jgi:hypothetical protein
VLGHEFAQPWYLVEAVTFVGKHVPAVHALTHHTTYVHTEANDRLAFLGDSLLNLLSVEDRAESLLSRERAALFLPALGPTITALVLDYTYPPAPTMPVLWKQVGALRSNQLWSRIGLARHLPRMWFQTSRELDQSYDTALGTLVGMVRDVQDTGVELTLAATALLRDRLLDRLPLPKEYADAMEASLGAVWMDAVGSLAAETLDVTTLLRDGFTYMRSRWAHIGGAEIRQASHAHVGRLVARKMVRNHLDPLDPAVLLEHTRVRARFANQAISSPVEDVDDEDELEDLGSRDDEDEGDVVC